MLGILLSVPLIFSGGYFGYKKPVLAVAIILVSLPAFLIRWTPVGLPVNTLDLLSLFTILIWATTHRDDIKRAIEEHRVQIILLLLWFLTASISLFFSPLILEALGILKSYFILPIAVIIMMLAVVQTKQDVKAVLLSLGILIFYNSFFAITQKISPGGFLELNPIPNQLWASPENFRATGLLQYPNALGLLIAPLLPLLIAAAALFTTREEKLFFLGTAILGFATVVLAVSKGALLGIAAGLLFVLLYYLKTTLTRT